MTSKRHRKRCRDPHVLKVGADKRRLRASHTLRALEVSGADGRAQKQAATPAKPA